MMTAAVGKNIKSWRLVERRCSTCRWVEHSVDVTPCVDIERWKCHGRAPDSNRHERAVWPRVEPRDWCRLWEQLPESAAEEE